MFTEVAILERFKGQPAICQLYDYAIDADGIVLVLRCYRCSLKEWRNRQQGGAGPHLRLYLAIFAQVLAAVQVGQAHDHRLTEVGRLSWITKRELVAGAGCSLSCDSFEQP